MIRVNLDLAGWWWRSDEPGVHFRWVFADKPQPDFGELWYNPITDDLMLRQTIQYAGESNCQVIQPDNKIPECIYIGDL